MFLFTAWLLIIFSVRGKETKPRINSLHEKKPAERWTRTRLQRVTQHETDSRRGCRSASDCNPMATGMQIPLNHQLVLLWLDTRFPCCFRPMDTRGINGNSCPLRIDPSFRQADQQPLSQPTAINTVLNFPGVEGGSSLVYMGVNLFRQ